MSCFFYNDAMMLIVADIFIHSIYVFYIVCCNYYYCHADPLLTVRFSTLAMIVYMNDRLTFYCIHTSMYEFVSKRIP